MTERETEFCPGSGQWAPALPASTTGEVVCKECGSRVVRQAAGLLQKDDVWGRATSHFRYVSDASS